MSRERKSATEMRECKHHGLTLYADAKGCFYCIKCKNERNIKRQRDVKLKAIGYKGGCCSVCGLVSEYPEVYDFHHRDPSKKEFGISKYGASKSWTRVKEELDKCDMVCSNCHRIIHAQSGGN